VKLKEESFSESPPLNEGPPSGYLDLRSFLNIKVPQNGGGRGRLEMLLLLFSCVASKTKKLIVSSRQNGVHYR